MELHAFDGMVPVAQAHNRAVAIFFGSPGADFQFCRQVFFLDDERVITGRRHRHGETLKDGAVVVHDGAGLAVHKICRPNDTAPEGFPDRLMSEADSEDRHFSREMADKINTDARFVRCARPGRDDDSGGPHLLNLAYRNLIVAANLNFSAEFTDVLHQVVGERIVVVEDENQEFATPDNSLHRRDDLELLP
jgi:hypothetical protein